jgi:SAM-dependent methyltransferase
VKLNLGCGRTRREGWLNVDHAEIPGVTDLVADLNEPGWAASLDYDTVDESVGEHVIEHLADPLAFMTGLWEVTKPGGTVTFDTPYGSSDDAWEDPTHVRPYFMNSWGYFSQPFYFRADYGYAADWRLTELILAVDGAKFADADPSLILAAVQHQRNTVLYMRATLEAVKPARPADADLREPLPLSFALVEA